MTLDWRVVPIERWPGEPTKRRQEHRFRTGSRRGVNWSATTDLLARELEHLRAKNILLQMAVTPRDIRKDGWIRGDARPHHPGVILTFDSKFGPLSYPCDTYFDWQANVRGIALALEALRAVDRYGVTRRGEQYTGWAQLPPAGGSSSTMTARTAAEILVDVEGKKGDPEDLLHDRNVVRYTYLNAAKNAHPDRHGGDTKRFQLLQEAKRILDVHHGATR